MHRGADTFADTSVCPQPDADTVFHMSTCGGLPRIACAVVEQIIAVEAASYGIPGAASCVAAFFLRAP